MKKKLIALALAMAMVLPMIGTAYAATKSAAPKLTITNVADTGKPYLRWSKVPGTVRYEVYKQDSSTGCEFVKLYSTHAGTRLTHSSARRGTTYRYMVQAVGGGGARVNSKVVTRTCDLARPHLRGQFCTSKSPLLTWDKVPGAVKYQVWCSVDREDAFRLLYETRTGTRLTHRSAKPGHMYFYRLRALSSNSGGHSAYSYTTGTDLK